MPSRFSRALCAALPISVALAASPHAASGAASPDLRGYNADIAQSSISGISSGGFMAVQFATAWSSVIRGVGVVAGGPFYCAQASLADILTGYVALGLRATGPCMKGVAPPDVGALTDAADGMAAAGDIDPPSNLNRQKIYVFHGTNDAVIAQPVTDATVAFYAHYLDAAHRGNLFYQTTIPAGHAQVTVDQPGAAGLNPCPVNQTPYVNQCGYDQAGIILQHIYGALNPPNRGALSGRVTPFAQGSYSTPFSTEALSMADDGFIYVPAACTEGAACRVHIALHGCLQDAGDIQRQYVDYAGYNAWADTNFIIVLYPQTRFASNLGVAPNNPEACWDWFGYQNQTSDYVTKSGRQIQTMKAMLDALTAAAAPASSTTPRTPAAPGGLVVTDTSDSQAALAWTPVPGADSYQIWRSVTGADFQVAGTSDTGASFSSTGLAAGTSYTWKVAAVIGGVEGLPSATATATTRQTPRLCNRPGSC